MQNCKSIPLSRLNLMCLDRCVLELTDDDLLMRKEDILSLMYSAGCEIKMIRYVQSELKALTFSGILLNTKIHKYLTKISGIGNEIARRQGTDVTIPIVCDITDRTASNARLYLILSEMLSTLCKKYPNVRYAFVNADKKHYNISVCYSFNRMLQTSKFDTILDFNVYTSKFCLQPLDIQSILLDQHSVLTSVYMTSDNIINLMLLDAIQLVFAENTDIITVF